MPNELIYEEYFRIRYPFHDRNILHQKISILEQLYQFQILQIISCQDIELFYQTLQVLCCFKTQVSLMWVDITPFSFTIQNNASLTFTCTLITWGLAKMQTLSHRSGAETDILSIMSTQRCCRWPGLHSESPEGVT